MIDLGKAGSPRKLSDEQVHYIVQRYIAKERRQGLIKYKDVFEFQNRLFENGEIPNKTEEDFWRKAGRPGRLKIDEANRFVKDTVLTSKKERTILDLIDKIRKLKNDPKAITALLKSLEDDVHSLIEKEKQLREKLDKTNQLLFEEKVKNKSLEEHNQKLQNLIYQLFDYCAHKENDIVNLMTTGKSRDPRVNEALKNAFSDPKSYFETMKEKNTDKRKLSVVVTQEAEKAKEEVAATMSDDYDWL